MTPPVKPDLSVTQIASKVEERLRARPSDSLVREERTWREAIRFAVVPLLILGFALMGHEVWEIVTCPRGETCKIHLGTMFWGIGMVVLALLIWQRGNVSSSAKELVDLGAGVRSRWFTRPGRDTDQEGTKVTTVVTQPPTEPKP
jgi:hypothetical protein